MTYKLKESVAEDIRNKFKNVYFEKTVGISKVYISLILNRHRGCSKSVAYCFAKAIDSEAEIEDYFEVA